MSDSDFSPRTIGPLLTRMLQESPALLLTGPRQSGKSTLLRNLFSSSHVYLSLDDPIIRGEAIEDPHGFLTRHGTHLIIDEVQYAPELFSYLKILIDEDRSTYGRFLLTGSEQFVLMKNLSESLAGRIRIFELLPFSLSEKPSFASPSEAFEQSAVRGSYPEIFLHPHFSTKNWYRSYLQTYVERDVRALHHVGDTTLFSRFISVLASRCAQFLNLSAIASDLGTSAPTLKRWLSILEASRIVYLLHPYYRSQGKRMRKQPKLYFTDIGFLCDFLHIHDQDALFNGPFKGAVFENFCIQETLKVFVEHGVEPSLFYFRTSNDLEVDLVLEIGGNLYPIEIKSTCTPALKMTKSLGKLVRLFPKLPFQEGKLLSLNPQSRFMNKTVSHVSLFDYLEWLRRMLL